MGTIPQWILDARKAERKRLKREAAKKAQPVMASSNPPQKRLNALKALRRSQSNTPTLKKHGQR